MNELLERLRVLRGYPTVRLPRAGMDWHPDPSGYFLQWHEVVAVLGGEDLPYDPAMPKCRATGWPHGQGCYLPQGHSGFHSEVVGTGSHSWPQRLAVDHVPGPTMVMLTPEQHATLHGPQVESYRGSMQPPSRG